MVESGSNLENPQYFENYVIFRFKIKSECGTSGLEQGNKCNGIPELSKIVLSVLKVTKYPRYKEIWSKVGKI